MPMPRTTWLSIGSSNGRAWKGTSKQQGGAEQYHCINSAATCKQVKLFYLAWCRIVVLYKKENIRCFRIRIAVNGLQQCSMHESARSFCYKGKRRQGRICISERKNDFVLEWMVRSKWINHYCIPWESIVGNRNAKAENQVAGGFISAAFWCQQRTWNIGGCKQNQIAGSGSSARNWSFLLLLGKINGDNVMSM